jgi:CheY-like chemotaxis protein
VHSGYRSFGGRRVLLVDDHPDSLELSALLLREKYTVVTCSSAAEALASLDTLKPDVVVLDIRMTPVDGVQCLQAIRSLPGYASIPAIAQTACASDVERTAFLDAGFQAVVTKPVLDHRVLEDLIDGLLGTSASLDPSVA